MNVGGRELQTWGRLIRVARLEGDKYEPLSDPEATLRAVRQSTRRIDLFTFMQTMPHTSPEYGYPMEWDNLAVLNVSTFEEWWTKQTNRLVRRMVRRANVSGVVVREVPFDAGLVRGISAIYNESPVRQRKRFPHYGQDLEAVRRMNGTFLDQATFIGAFLGHSLIGFAKLVWDHDRQQAGFMQILSMLQHRDKAPMYALMAQAVRFCAEHRIPHLVYSSFSYGKKHRDGLSDFKTHNGFQRAELPRYYVPLTLLGRVALRLQLYRGPQDWIPESVQASLRALRAHWYARTLQVGQPRP